MSVLWFTGTRISLQYIHHRKTLDQMYRYLTLSSNASFIRSCAYVSFLMIDMGQVQQIDLFFADNPDMLPINAIP